MPRLPRNIQDTSVAHIISRGVDKRDIFTNDGERRIFLAFLRDSFKKTGVKLFAYCLMSNHFHLLLSVTSTPISVPMHLVLARYAQYFNLRNGRVGHLFQNRFHSIACLDLNYFTTLVEYIHKNPVRAGMVANPALWPWSSHQELVNGETRYLNLVDLEEHIGITDSELRDEYMARLRRADDEMFTLDEVIREAAALVGLTPDQLRAGGRGTAFTLGRVRALKRGSQAGFTLKELAAALNCTSEALYQLRREAAKPSARSAKPGACPPA